MKKGMNNSAFRLVAALSVGLLIVQPVFAGERNGSMVHIITEDGPAITGELIAVRDKSLLVRDQGMGFSNTDISKISNLSLKRKSRVLGGMIAGLLGGTMLGIAFKGLATPSSELSVCNLVKGAGIGAWAGFMYGTWVGAAQSSDIVLIKDGRCLKPEAEILEELAALAKVPDAV